MPPVEIRYVDELGNVKLLPSVSEWACDESGVWVLRTKLQMPALRNCQSQPAVSAPLQSVGDDVPGAETKPPEALPCAGENDAEQGFLVTEENLKELDPGKFDSSKVHRVGASQLWIALRDWQAMLPTSEDARVVETKLDYTYIQP